MILRTIPVLFFGCFVASDATAQEIPRSTRVWAALGLGAGMPASGGDGIGNMAQIVYEKNPHHASIRGLVLHDLDRETDTIGEIGVLYGRTDVFARARVAVAAGISAVAFDTCPD